MIFVSSMICPLSHGITSWWERLENHIALFVSYEVSYIISFDWVCGDFAARKLTRLTLEQVF